MAATLGASLLYGNPQAARRRALGVFELARFVLARVSRRGASLPPFCAVAQPGLDTFDLKPQGRASRKGKLDLPGRRFGLLKSDAEQIQHARLVLLRNPQAGDFDDPVEMQRGAA